MEENKDFFSSGVYGCSYYPRVKCDGNITNKKSKLISKVQVNNFFSINEYKIGKKVNQIDSETFIGAEKKCNIQKNKLKNISKKHNCKILKKKKNNFVILYSKYVKSVECKDFLFNNYYIKRFFMYYNFMLNSINKLINNNIIHKDLHLGNVIYNKEKNSFHIIDFGLSIDTTKFYVKGKLNYQYLKNIFIDYDPTWEFWSIDNHILCYYLYKNKDLDEEDLNDMLDKYLLNNFVYNKIYKKTQIKDKMFKYYKDKYINSTTIEENIKYILKNCWKTWDLYQLSYISLIILISESHNDLNSLKNMLIKSIDVDYTKRPGINTLYSGFYNIVNSYNKSNMIKKYESKTNIKNIIKSKRS